MIICSHSVQLFDTKDCKIIVLKNKAFLIFVSLAVSTIQVLTFYTA